VWGLQEGVVRLEPGVVASWRTGLFRSEQLLLEFLDFFPGDDECGTLLARAAPAFFRNFSPSYFAVPALGELKDKDRLVVNNLPPTSFMVIKAAKASSSRTDRRPRSQCCRQRIRKHWAHPSCGERAGFFCGAEMMFNPFLDTMMLLFSSDPPQSLNPLRAHFFSLPTIFCCHIIIVIHYLDGYDEAQLKK